MNNKEIIIRAFRDKGLDIMQIHKRADEFYENRPCIMVDFHSQVVKTTRILINSDLEISINLDPEIVSNELHKINKWLAIERWYKAHELHEDLIYPTTIS